MVLGNRGAKNYYQERFSSHWVFWDFNTYNDNLGISGNYFNPENWEEVAKIFPEKFNYIATDFNVLTKRENRNEIIEQATKVLCKGGALCLEDDFMNKTGKFKNFTEEDFKEFSKNYDVKFAFWDGYIASLPYTNYQSQNRRADWYKGIELMLLRLAVANSRDRKQLLPYITSDLDSSIFFIDEKLISRMIKDITGSSILNKMLNDYIRFDEERKLVEEVIIQEKKEMELLEKDIKNFSKMSDFSKKVKDSFSKVNKGLRVIRRGAAYVTGSQGDGEAGVMSKVSKFFSREKRTQELDDMIARKKEMYGNKEKSREELKTQLGLLAQSMEQITADIIQHNAEIFETFKKDKFLKHYMHY